MKSFLEALFLSQQTSPLSQQLFIQHSMTSGRDLDSLSRPHLGHWTAFTSDPCWNFHLCYKFLQNINLVNSTYF